MLTCFFPSPSLISGDTHRHDLILHNKRSNFLYLIEHTVGFESNLKANSEHELTKYRPIVASLSFSHNKVKFVNVPMSALGVLGNSCESITKYTERPGYRSINITTSSFIDYEHWHLFNLLYILYILPQK